MSLYFPLVFLEEKGVEEAALGTSPGGSGCRVSVVQHPNLVVLGGFVVSALACTTYNLFLFRSFLFRGCQSLNNLRVNK